MNRLLQWVHNLGREPQVRYEWFATPLRHSPPKDSDDVVISTQSFCPKCFGTRTFVYDPVRAADPTVTPRPSRGWHCMACDSELITADRLVAVYH